MPNPKRRHSKTRSKSRRTHYKATTPTLAKCNVTGVVHRMHRAYEVDGNLFYNGKLLVEAKTEA